MYEEITIPCEEKKTCVWNLQSRKTYSFVPHAKMNGKVGFHASFPLWFIHIQRVVIFLWMGIPFIWWKFKAIEFIWLHKMALVVPKVPLIRNEFSRAVDGNRPMGPVHRQFSIHRCGTLFGLSKERPILDHHPKAQSEMRRFSYEMRHFSWKALCFSYEKHLKSLTAADSTQISHLDLVFHRVQREGHSWKAPLFMWKAPLFAAFREKRRFSKDHLQGIVTLCFGFCLPHYCDHGC